MLTSLQVYNFGCVRKATLELSPLHALVGPNDSGKSTLLQAIQLIGEFIGDERPVAVGGVDKESESSHIEVELEGSDSPVHANIEFQHGRWVATRLLPDFDRLPGYPRLCRFRPDRLRMPSSYVTPEGVAGFPAEADGAGLAGVLDAILSEGDGRFEEISNELRRQFPTVKALRVPAINGNAKQVGVRTVDDTLVQANQLSEGLLYYLAFLAIKHGSKAPILLVEEPENGLHPARIADVVRVLRDISERGTQVILATHSPLVLNELKPHEVSIVTRPLDRGTQVTRMDKTRNFERRANAFALGELWLTFCNGNDEADLVGDGPTT